MVGICHFEIFVAAGTAGIAKIAGGRAKAGTGMPVTHHYCDENIGRLDIREKLALDPSSTVLLESLECLKWLTSEKKRWQH